GRILRRPQPESHVMDAIAHLPRHRSPDALLRAERGLFEKLTNMAGALEQRLGVPLVTVVVVGSFGRGEGGWVKGPEGLVPHNDVDIVVVVEGGAHRLRGPLHAIGQELSADGYEIDLWPVDKSSLMPPPRTLLWLDVAHG